VSPHVSSPTLGYYYYPRLPRGSCIKCVCCCTRRGFTRTSTCCACDCTRRPTFSTPTKSTTTLSYYLLLLRKFGARPQVPVAGRTIVLCGSLYYRKDLTVYPCDTETLVTSQDTTTGCILLRGIYYYGVYYCVT